MRRFSKIAVGIAIGLVSLSIIGCQSTQVVAKRDTSLDIEGIKRVAVVPFENYSRDRLAGDKVTAIFISALCKTTSVEIIEPGELQNALAANGVEKFKLTPLLIKKVGKSINAQAIIFGSVGEYALEKFGNTTLPVVSISARMVDVETGRVLWVATASDTGLSRVPIINIGVIHTRTALASKIARKLISRVYSQ